MRKRSIFKAVSALAVATIMTMGVSVSVLAANLHDDETGMKVFLNSEGFDRGTTIEFKLSEADKAVLSKDVLGLASIDDLFYFDSSKSSADLSTVKDARVTVAYYTRGSDGTLVGDGGELVGYIGKSEYDYSNLNISGQPLEYGRRFNWKWHVDGYGKNGGIYTITMEDNDGSWSTWSITFDADLFSYAKDASVATVTSSWASDSKGWWIQNSDGTYLTNSWYHDTDGKWYYMGSDGYMLTNTTTPDGYIVNAAGVWVQ